MGPSFSVQPRSALAVAAVLAALAAGAAAVTARDVAVDVVVDMTADGRKVAPPTSQNPAFYVPVLGGYLQRGAIVAGEPPPPPPMAIAHLVATTLAQQGYFVTNAKSPPSLVLSIFWGSMNPQIDNFDLGNDAATKMFFNQNEMVALVGGNTLHNLDLNFEREGVMQGAERDRYFVVISAYDFNAYAESKKPAPSDGHRRNRPPQPIRKVLLWQAKMSVPSNGVSLDEVLPILVKAGGPQFGRETIRPKSVFTPLPEGHVEIGTPQVKGYANPGDAGGPPIKSQ